MTGSNIHTVHENESSVVNGITNVDSIWIQDNVLSVEDKRGK